MNIAALQAALNARGHSPLLATDGVAGRQTLAAVDAELAKLPALAFDDWPDARRLVAFEQLVYRAAGIEVGEIDGLVGEQTRYARAVAAARASGDRQKVVAVERWRDNELKRRPPVPSESQVLWPRQTAAAALFGPVGSDQVMLVLPFPMRLAWEPARIVQRVSCHGKVEAPLRRIWSRVLEQYGYERLKQLRLDLFGGCLNVRRMRGGSAWSMHAWGAAWDVDPDRNRLKWGRALAALDDAAYAPFWSIVEAEGAVSLGRARDYDWMHFQFARL